jgi:glycosyltransferase involved in cell wall biosynthesis/predicted O-methyltransferase YrrM
MLVSCIMPTYNRRRFVPLAIQYFLRQDYPEKELIIVDDGSDAIDDLIPSEARIRYMRLHEKATVGAKRNLACEQARGEIIAHWDDDDWHAPHRLRYQVEMLLRSGSEVCGINTLLFYDMNAGRAWQYVYPAGQRFWLSGSSLCYTRAFWASHRFANLNVGEDGRFVWSGRPECMAVLPDSTFHVGLIHGRNVSPKQTHGAYWRPYPLEEIQRLLGKDWAYYAGVTEPLPAIGKIGEERAVTPVRNLFACLVHESQECVIDLVRNLRYFDPSSIILLYNGGNDPRLLNSQFPLERYGAIVHPRPRSLAWGRLHEFALDCMQFALDHFAFDTLTIVDSDQLAVRPGYSECLSRFLAAHSGIGMLGNSPSRQPPNTRVGPAMAAFKEIDLWRPFLRRFADGENKFVYWTFWPSTVFTAEAARDLTKLFSADTQLQDLMRRTKIWATEEVILPTLVALLGHKIAANPCSYDYVKYRQPYTPAQVDKALANPNVYWLHPVTRRYEDGLRKQVRARFQHYEKPFCRGETMTTAENNTHARLLLTLPILARMKRVEGWLEEDEADLLIAAATAALKNLPKPHAIVEVGSYCGRSTVVLGSVAQAVAPETKIYSIDPHDGKVGALDQGIRAFPPTLEKFKRNIADAGLTGMVEIIQAHPGEVKWETPITLLLIDGLHDYANVAQDFFHFEPWLVPNGYIAFHDYADYYPGVKAFVNEILGSGGYCKTECAGSLMVVRKQPTKACGGND